MDRDDNTTNGQLLRELQWLAHYFNEYSREDLAQEIFEQITKLRQRARESLTSERADSIDIDVLRANRSQ